MQFDAINRFRDEGKWLEAAHLVASSLLDDPSSMHVWVDYGHMLKEGGALEQAAYAYRAAIRRDGSAPDPRLHLAHLLKRLGRIQEAYDAFLALEKLPAAPNVRQEIAGLKVALSHEEWPVSSATSRESRPIETEDMSDFQLLQIAEKASIEKTEQSDVLQPFPKKQGTKSRTLSLDLLSQSKKLICNLVPRSDLVVRDGVLISTTNNPQFTVEIKQGGLQSGWFEVEIRIVANVPFVEPVILFEHLPEWATFSFFRMESLDRDKFYALCYVENEVRRLRLDPLTFKGPFWVSDFKIRQVSLSRAVRAAYRKNAAAVRRTVRNLRSHRSTFEREIAAICQYPGKTAYQKWIASQGTKTTEQREAHAQMVGQWKKRPTFSLIVILSSIHPANALFTSIIDQSYGDWKTLIVCSPFLSQSARKHLNNLCKTDTRFSVQPTFSLAIESCTGDYIVVVGTDGIVETSALGQFAEQVVAKPSTEILYGDEDHIDSSGTRHSPLFKPDWNFDYFLSSGYLGNLVAIKSVTMRAVVSKNEPSAETTSFEIIARCAARVHPDLISHLPWISFHRHTHGDANRDNQEALPWRLGRTERDVIEAVAQTENKEARVEILASGIAKVSWPLPLNAPKVTLIIPTRDHVEMLSNCINSLLRETAYPDFEILIVDNGSVEEQTFDYFRMLQANSNIRVLPVPGEFNFSRLNNLAAREASGDILGLINNDVLAIDDKWLAEMVSHAVRPQVGAVGARLVYRSNHVQHAGIVCGIGLVAGHPHKFRASSDLGYMGRIAATQTLSAVTAACLVIEKKKYWNVGGLDEEKLRIAFNDVDLCLKLDAAGYRNIYTPHAELVHLESISRGLDISPEKAARYREEAKFMLSKWSARIKRDPYYNPALTVEREDYSVRE